MPVDLDEHLILGNSELRRPRRQVPFTSVGLPEYPDEWVKLTRVRIGWRSVVADRHRGGAVCLYASLAFHGVRSLPLSLCVTRSNLLCVQEG